MWCRGAHLPGAVAAAVAGAVRLTPLVIACITRRCTFEGGASSSAHSPGAAAAAAAAAEAPACSAAGSKACSKAFDSGTRRDGDECTLPDSGKKPC